MTCAAALGWTKTTDTSCFLPSFFPLLFLSTEDTEELELCSPENVRRVEWEEWKSGREGNTSRTEYNKGRYFHDRRRPDFLNLTLDLSGFVCFSTKNVFTKVGLGKGCEYFKNLECTRRKILFVSFFPINIDCQPKPTWVQMLHAMHMLFVTIVFLILLGRI